MSNMVLKKVAMPRNAAILTICNALFIVSISIDLTLTGIVGYQMAPSPLLATLPFALITVGAALSTWSASAFMGRAGRQVGFMIGTASGAVGGMLSVYAVLHGNFWLFCAGTFLVGVWQAFAQYYRLAATDNVPDAEKARAISIVMAGGLIAAIIGPTLAAWSTGWLNDPMFAGAYIAITFLALISMLLLFFYHDDVAKLVVSSRAGGRSRQQIFTQPVFRAAMANNVVSGVVMMLLMTAAPIAALGCGLSINSSASIIQWHLFGMYAPSFFTGMLITRYGIANVVYSGVALNVFCVVTAMLSQSTIGFHIALFQLGVGWNFIFVAGTTLLTKSHTDEERARVQGIGELFRFTGTAAGALMAGPLLEVFGWETINLAMLPLLAYAAWKTFQWHRLETTTSWQRSKSPS